MPTSAPDRTASLEELRAHLMASHPLRLLWLSDLPQRDAVRIESIRMDPEARGRGHGTAVMEEIVRWADANERILVLTPSPDFDIPEKGTAAQKKRLIRWYRRFGFVPNKGARKDYRFMDTMIRHPKTVSSRRRNPIELSPKELVDYPPQTYLGTLISPVSLIPVAFFVNRRYGDDFLAGTPNRENWFGRGAVYPPKEDDEDPPLRHPFRDAADESEPCADYRTPHIFTRPGLQETVFLGGALMIAASPAFEEAGVNPVLSAYTGLRCAKVDVQDMDEPEREIRSWENVEAWGLARGTRDGFELYWSDVLTSGLVLHLGPFFEHPTDRPLIPPLVFSRLNFLSTPPEWIYAYAQQNIAVVHDQYGSGEGWIEAVACYLGPTYVASWLLRGIGIDPQRFFARRSANPRGCPTTFLEEDRAWQAKWRRDTGVQQRRNLDRTAQLRRRLSRSR